MIAHPSSAELAPPEPCAGFSLVEVVVATFIMTAVTVVAMSALLSAIAYAGEGATQVTMVAKARGAEQRMSRIIQGCRAVSASSNGVDLVMNDLTVGRISYEDLDNNIDTLANNILLFDANVNVTSDETVLCDLVTPIPSTPMFQNLATSPQTVLMSFHVGEMPPSGGPEVLMAHQGYQGLEIRVTAMPRNSRGLSY